MIAGELSGHLANQKLTNNTVQTTTDFGWLNPRFAGVSVVRCIAILGDSAGEKTHIFGS